MDQIVETTKRRTWRGNKYIWMLVSAAAVSALLYWEQIALLYVISTLMLTALLLVVAFSELEGKNGELIKPADTDAATISEEHTVPPIRVVTHSHSIRSRRESLWDDAQAIPFSREVNNMSKRMKVLIGYDGSSYADAAIDDLRRAGLPNEIEALVVSVGDSPIVPPLASHTVIEKAVIGERVVSIVEHANQQASQALQQSNQLALNASRRVNAQFPNWQVSGKAIAGSPASELVRKAEEWRADLIVVGSEGRSAIGRLILGSVSLEVAREAHCSVRIGRRRVEKSDQMKLRILIGLDGSPAAERALCRSLMREWPEGTELRIVAVDDGSSPITIADLGSISDKHVREDTSVTASRMINLAGTRGFSVSAEIKKGDPQRVLMAEAREWEADCIVIGAGGLSNEAEGFFTVSVSTGLAANADCSIEILR